jgi:hypothetical protein
MRNEKLRSSVNVADKDMKAPLLLNSEFFEEEKKTTTS